MSVKVGCCLGTAPSWVPLEPSGSWVQPLTNEVMGCFRDQRPFQRGLSWVHGRATPVVFHCWASGCVHPQVQAWRPRVMLAGSRDDAG